MTQSLAGRTDRIRRAFGDAKIQALLVTNPLSVRYLFGVQDAGWALVTARSVSIMPFPLSFEAVRREAVRAWRVLPPDGRLDRLVAILRRERVTRLGVESRAMSVETHEAMRRGIGEAAILVPAPGIVEAARARKDSVERSLLMKVGSLTAVIAAELSFLLRAGLSESEIAGLIDRKMRKAGADGPAFETIVLSAERSALPHGRPSGRRLSPGDICLVDFGAKLDGYHSDITRVFAIERVTARQRSVYRSVRMAYEAARRRVRPGCRASVPDLAARAALGSLSPRFMHGLGHGVGLEIHEGPRLARKETTILRAGHVVTVEPGVYMPGWGGMRLEDTYAVTMRGARSLTGSPASEIPIAGGALVRKEDAG
jgi:Xaa-Pro aminopeptidase